MIAIATKSRKNNKYFLFRDIDYFGVEAAVCVWGGVFNEIAIFSSPIFPHKRSRCVLWLQFILPSGPYANALVAKSALHKTIWRICLFTFGLMIHV